MFEVFTTVGIVGAVIAVGVLIRNEQVFNYRSRLINKIYRANMNDIINGRQHEWRHEAYDKVSYNEMVLKFWKTPASFFEGTGLND